MKAREYFMGTMRHLKNQAGRSGKMAIEPYQRTETFHCMMSDHQGRRCSVGYWLPEGVVENEDQSATVVRLAELYYGTFIEMVPEGMPVMEAVTFWGELQKFHDREKNWQGDRFMPAEQDLREFAFRWGLAVYDEFYKEVTT